MASKLYLRFLSSVFSVTRREKASQQTNTCSKSITETLEKGVKHIHG